MTRAVPALLLVLVLLAAFAPTGPMPASADEHPDHCPVDPDDVEVPGAEYVQAVCLDDLTTKNNERTDTGGSTGAGTRENGTLHSAHTEHPDDEVPGLQIEGWFPDSCSNWELETNTFIPSCDGGFRHNSQFVIRIPNDWDGETLLVSGTPGVRTHFADDIILSDRALVRDWAYASQDKGNTGLNFFRSGDTETTGDDPWIPGKASEQWAELMGTTAEAAQAVVAQVHGNAPVRTYAAGISNGGYQTRLALERHPDLFDGGVDWEGTTLFADGPNLLTYIPPILRNYHAATAGDADAYRAMVHEGKLPPLSEPVWDYHWTIYWGLVQSTYRPLWDPEYTDYVALPRVVAPGDPDADYEYFERPDFVAERIAADENSGDTHGLPLITLHPDLDALLPIVTASDAYAEQVRAVGGGDAFRYYVVQGGTHVDPLADDVDHMRPVYPCFLESLDALDLWVREGVEPPPSGLVPFPEGADEVEQANHCDLPEPIDRVAGDDRVETSIAASVEAFTIAETVVIATAGDFPDALTAAPLAAGLDAPILLVRDELTDAHRDELHRLGAFEAVIVGGEEAVSAEVAGQLEEEGLDVRRVFGPDRYATAAAVAEEVGAADGEAFVATGERFPDALSGAPVAAMLDVPVLLTRHGSLHGATRNALDDLGVTRTHVLGGPAAISDAVVAQLPNPERLAGAERYGTSAAVADFAVRRGAQVEHLHVATGTNFPDALAAGVVAALGPRGAVGDGVVLLVDPGDLPRSAPSAQWVATHAGDVKRLLIYGGSSAVSDRVAGQLAATTR